MAIQASPKPQIGWNSFINCWGLFAYAPALLDFFWCTLQGTLTTYPTSNGALEKSSKKQVGAGGWRGYVKYFPSGYTTNLVCCWCFLLLKMLLSWLGLNLKSIEIYWGLGDHRVMKKIRVAFRRWASPKIGMLCLVEGVYKIVCTNASRVVEVTNTSTVSR